MAALNCGIILNLFFVVVRVGSGDWSIDHLFFFFFFHSIWGLPGSWYDEWFLTETRIFLRVLRLWILCKPVLAGLLWYHSSRGMKGGGRGTSLLPGRGGSHGTHLGLVDTWRWGSPHCSRAFSNVIQGNAGHLITASWRWKFRVPPSLGLCGWTCADVFFPLWYLARVGWLLSKSFLSASLPLC